MFFIRIFSKTYLSLRFTTCKYLSQPKLPFWSELNSKYLIAAKTPMHIKGVFTNGARKKYHSSYSTTSIKSLCWTPQTLLEQRSADKRSQTFLFLECLFIWNQSRPNMRSLDQVQIHPAGWYFKKRQCAEPINRHNQKRSISAARSRDRACCLHLHLHYRRCGSLKASAAILGPLLSSRSPPPPTQPSITLRLWDPRRPRLPAWEMCCCSAGGFQRLPGPIRGSSKVSVPDKVNIVIRADPLAQRPTPADWRLTQLIIALLFNTTRGYLPARQAGEREARRASEPRARRRLPPPSLRLRKNLHYWFPRRAG